jgi:hypothetical protein
MIPNKSVFTRYHLLFYAAIVIALVLYLMQVNKEKKDSVEAHFNNTRIGDVWKVSIDKGDGRMYTSYKIKDTSRENVYFYTCKFYDGNLYSASLRQFDNKAIAVFSRKDLQDIKDKKWYTEEHHYIRLERIEPAGKN